MKIRSCSGFRILNLARMVAAVGILSLAAGSNTVQAQPITVPNFSFESQTAPDDPQYNYINVFVDSWQKIAEPAYYATNIGIPFGIPWIGTAGVFLNTYTGNTNAYQNS